MVYDDSILTGLDLPKKYLDALKQEGITPSDKVNGKDVEFASIVNFQRGKGRPKGSKDKIPGSEARRKANRQNAFQNGNGTNRTDLDRFQFQGVEISEDDVSKYGRMYSDALKGQCDELEVDMSQTLGRMYALYKSLLLTVLKNGADIPIHVVGPDGVVIQDSKGNDIVRAVKTLRGTIDLINDLRKALGIDADAMVLTAKSQSRQRAISNEGTLDEVERSMSELTEQQKKFGTEV